MLAATVLNFISSAQNLAQSRKNPDLWRLVWIDLISPIWRDGGCKARPQGLPPIDLQDRPKACDCRATGRI